MDHSQRARARCRSEGGEWVGEWLGGGDLAAIYLQWRPPPAACAPPPWPPQLLKRSKIINFSSQSGCNKQEEEEEGGEEGGKEGRCRSTQAICLAISKPQREREIGGREGEKEGEEKQSLSNFLECLLGFCFLFSTFDCPLTPGQVHWSSWRPSYGPYETNHHFWVEG